jgi:hypothetical protein
MSHDKDPADASLSRLLKMQLEIATQHDLRHKTQHQPIRKLGMSIRPELTTLVRVAEEVGDDSDNGSDDLNGDVPARTNNL